MKALATLWGSKGQRKGFLDKGAGNEAEVGPFNKIRP